MLRRPLPSPHPPPPSLKENFEQKRLNLPAETSCIWNVPFSFPLVATLFFADIFLKHTDVNIVPIDRNVRFVLFTKTLNAQSITFSKVCDGKLTKRLSLTVNRSIDRPFKSAEVSLCPLLVFHFTHFCLIYPI